MVLSVLTALLLAQGSPTMAGPSVAALRGSSAPAIPDHFTALLVNADLTDCLAFTITATGGETVTQTRASSAYCTASTGAMTLRSSNEMRVSAFGYGVLVEGESTNVALRSEDPSHADWSGTATITANVRAPPWGGSSMDTETTSSTNKYQCPSVSSTVGPFTFSTYGAAPVGDTTNQARQEIICVAANADPLTCAAHRDDGASATGVTSSGTCAGTSTFSETIARVQTTTTCDAAKTQFCFATYGGSPDDSHDWAGFQAEVGNARASSYIATAGTSATRAAEDIHFTPSVAISSTGCFVVDVTFDNASPTVGARAIAGAGATGLYFDTGDAFTLSDGTNTVTVDPGIPTFDQFRIRAAWSGSEMSLSVNGVTVTGTFDGNMDMGTVYVGSQTATSNWLNGWIKDLYMGAGYTGCDDGY